MAGMGCLAMGDLPNNGYSQYSGTLGKPVHFQQKDYFLIRRAHYLSHWETNLSWTS
jgi:hypothetical protein